MISDASGTRPQSERKQSAVESPPILYAQHYATDSDPDQPVQAKSLTWDGSGFAVYGIPFRVGDTAFASTVGAGQRFHVIWNDSSRRWLPFSSADYPPAPLRRFVLTAAKEVGDLTATAQFIDNAGAAAGDPFTIYDPKGYFSGRVVNYISGEAAFAGVALQRTDLGGTDPDRWEIVILESFADWVVLEYDEEAEGWLLSDFGGIEWRTRRPAEDEGPITLSDPLGQLPGIPAGGTKVVAELEDPDTDPPTYQLRDAKVTDLYRMVTGFVYADVSADDTTFEIDHVQAVAGGASPLVDPGDETERLTVHLTQKESLQSGTMVTAVYNSGGLSPEWDLLTCERYRTIIGYTTDAVAAEDATFTIDQISVLDSGLDPRTDTTDVDETIEVVNFTGTARDAAELVYADYHAADGTWLARPKASATGSALRWGAVYSTIGPATAWGAWGTGEVQLKDETGADDGSPIEVENWFPSEFITATSVCVDTSFEPPRVVSGSCETMPEEEE